MDRIKLFIKRYRVFLVLAVLNALLIILKPELGTRSLVLSWENTLEMLSVVPPIFILLGLLDVWVKKEVMVKFLGEGSGFRGILIAFFLGSAAAGPLYAAFPLAVVLLRKGSKLSNVLIMLGAWSTTKIPLLLFEVASMGLKFTVIRLILNLFGITLMAYLTDRMLRKEEKEDIFSRAAASE